MADAQDDPKFEFKAPEENRKKWEPKKWENQAFQGVSPFDFAMRQKNEKKRVKEMEAQAKAGMYNYEGKGVQTLVEVNAKNVNAEYEKGKQAARDTKDTSAKVNMAAAGLTVEEQSRNADFEREKGWKQKQKEAKETEKNVNMAASGFGAEHQSRNADFEREKGWKQKQRETKTEEANVNMAAAGFTVEQQSRNADFERDQQWKQKQREEKKNQSEFDMAKALF